MKEKKLDIDRQKHTVYSRRAKQAVQKRLEAEYGPEDADILWGTVQKQYVAFLRECPEYGGKKNSKSSVIYDALLMFAWYAAVPHRPGTDEMRKLANDMFVEPAKKMKKVYGLGMPGGFKAAGKILIKQLEKDAKSCEKYDGFVSSGDAIDPARGILAFHFDKCPLAEFAKANGLEEMMPSLCNTEFRVVKELSGELIRRGTVMSGDKCDFCVLKQDDPVATCYITDVDEKGYLISRQIEDQTAGDQAAEDGGEE